MAYDPEACRSPFCCNGQCRYCHGTGTMRVDPALGFYEGILEEYNVTFEEYVETMCARPCPVCKSNEE